MPFKKRYKYLEEIQITLSYILLATTWLAMLYCKEGREIPRESSMRIIIKGREWMLDNPLTIPSSSEATEQEKLSYTVDGSTHVYLKSNLVISDMAECIPCLMTQFHF